MSQRKTAAQKPERPFSIQILNSDFRIQASVSLRARSPPHVRGDDADLLDTCTLGRVDDFDDVLVAERFRAGDEHLLVFAGLENRPQTALELRDTDVGLVDRDLSISRVLQHDLADVALLLLLTR